MATANEFIKRLAKAAGLPETNAEVQTLLTNEELAKVEVPDLFENMIHQNLMNIEAAKNNSKLSEHFKAQALNGVDAIVLEKAAELGLDQADIDALKAADKTGKRIAMLTEKLEKKGASKDKGDKAEWEKKVSDLHAQLSTAKTEYETKLTAEKTNYVAKLKNTSLDSKLSQFEYGTELPQDVNIQTAKFLINRKLSEKKFRDNYNPETNEFSLLGEDGLEAFEGNTRVQFDDFLKSVLAENKLLKVSGEPAKTPAQTQTTTTTQSAQADFSMIDQQLAMLAKQK